MSFTKKALLTAGAVVALSTGLPGGQAFATPSCTGTTTQIPTTGGSILASAIAAGDCVQLQDKLYGNFNFGSGATALPDGTLLIFSLQVVGTDEHHGLSFSGNYVNGTTYNFGYEINETSGSFMSRLTADFTQPTGTSTLTKQTTPLGTPTSGINLKKVGTVATGQGQIDYSLFVGDLIINEQLVDGGVVSSIANTVIESSPPSLVPEPASLAILGAGLLGLGGLRRRFRKS